MARRIIENGKTIYTSNGTARYTHAVVVDADLDAWREYTARSIAEVAGFSRWTDEEKANQKAHSEDRLARIEAEPTSVYSEHKSLTAALKSLAKANADKMFHSARIVEVTLDHPAPEVDLEDDPAKVAQANAQDDDYPPARGYCERHGADWYDNEARCEIAQTFKNSRNVCRQPSNIG